MRKKILTPFNVQQELIHFYFLSFVYIIMLRSQKIMTMECYLCIIKQTERTNLLENWLNCLTIFFGKDRLIGQVTMGTKQQPIRIPGNSTITILGCTSKLPSRITCLVEQAEHHNLPLGIVINSVWPHQMGPVILINTNRYNVWIR